MQGSNAAPRMARVSRSWGSDISLSPGIPLQAGLFSFIPRAQLLGDGRLCSSGAAL